MISTAKAGQKLYKCVRVGAGAGAGAGTGAGVPNKYVKLKLYKCVVSNIHVELKLKNN